MNCLFRRKKSKINNCKYTRQYDENEIDHRKSLMFNHREVQTPESKMRTTQYQNIGNKHRLLIGLSCSRTSTLVTTLEIVDNIVRDRGDRLDRGALNHEPWLGTCRLPLGADDLATGLGLRLELVVVDLPQTELLLAPGWLHMLHTDMDPLLDDAVTNLMTGNTCYGLC
jgi:hypothetical protein